MVRYWNSQGIQPEGFRQAKLNRVLKPVSVGFEVVDGFRNIEIYRILKPQNPIPLPYIIFNFQGAKTISQWLIAETHGVLKETKKFTGYSNEKKIFYIDVEVFET